MPRHRFPVSSRTDALIEWAFWERAAARQMRRDLGRSASSYLVNHDEFVRLSTARRYRYIRVNSSKKLPSSKLSRTDSASLKRRLARLIAFSGDLRGQFDDIEDILALLLRQAAEEAQETDGHRVGKVIH